MLSRDHEFSNNQRKYLSNFVTNLESNVFALKNLPEVVKGALFSKYSRSVLGLRSLLVKEFLKCEDVEDIDPSVIFDLGVHGASDFYQRVLDGYGDDSVGELGGAHLAIENVSVLAAKIIEDARIGGSPLEKSTRYVYFDQKVRGEYLYYRDPILMTSAFKDVFLNTCDFLFETYSNLIPQVRSYFEKLYPRPLEVSETAYSTSLRAKVLDCVRGVLPATTLTNLGLFGNGRFWQTLLHKLQGHNLSEVRLLGENALTELMKVIPSFVSRAETHHNHHQSMMMFRQNLKNQLKNLAKTVSSEEELEFNQPGVKLIYGDPDGIYKVAAGFLFPYANRSLSSLINICRNMSSEELLRVLEAGTSGRENRRHKSPRGLECAEFCFDVLADFGIYRDLQRHRILTQERQLLSTNYGYNLPEELIDTPMEKTFREAMEKAGEAYNEISQEFPEEAQYVVPMAHNIRWFFHINGRALQWLCELRSQPQGHRNYRIIAINMVKEVIKFNPMYEIFFKFVDYSDVELGRMQQEMRKELAP
ncbi:FAD-dependent thymidylate synthase [Chlamydia sp. 17-3921]|uniref:FAD-dependent thymidylate synthase n=1 Tax=Chlamydia sp. 17-3921 TaxID=2675798 RepID=UPI00191AFCA6|nr:FAD-dependent thymidylate synthase [Chlamydia sp. 17-3921]